MPVARVNDIELNYRLEGDGDETIVLVNGLARRAADQYQPSSTSWIQAKRGLP
jgi:hypothetical protein